MAHSLDVAATAVLLSRPPGLAMPARTVAFLVALHHIGKVSRRFQAMVPACWPTEVLGPLPAFGMPAEPRHDTLGYRLLRQDLARLLDPVLPPTAWRSFAREPLLRALAGHHGRPPAMLDAAPGEAILGEASRDAAAAFLAAMLALFDPDPLPGVATDREPDILGWALAGHVTLADWIGSRQAWFPYAPIEAAADPTAYLWDRALSQRG